MKYFVNTGNSKTPFDAEIDRDRKDLFWPLVFFLIDGISNKMFRLSCNLFSNEITFFHFIFHF